MQNSFLAVPLKVAACAAGLGLLSGAASAATLSITVTNTSPNLTFTPVWAALHNGSFDSFDAGSAASPGVQRIAELGDPSVVQGELLAAQPGATSTVIAAGAIPPIQPGESNTVQLVVDPSSQRFFSFLSMILPSNDTFIGNDDAMAYALFDMGGTFLGPRVINFGLSHLFDAGTELLDPADAPFVVGGDGLANDAEGGVVHSAESLSAFNGLTLADGSVFDFESNNYLTNPDGFVLGQISISLVPPAAVPLPASAPLIAGAIGLLGALRLRRRKTA